MQSGGPDMRMGWCVWDGSASVCEEAQKPHALQIYIGHGTYLYVLPKVNDGVRHGRARNHVPSDLGKQHARERALRARVAPAVIDPGSLFAEIGTLEAREDDVLGEVGRVLPFEDLNFFPLRDDGSKSAILCVLESRTGQQKLLCKI